MAKPCALIQLVAVFMLGLQASCLKDVSMDVGINNTNPSLLVYKGNMYVAIRALKFERMQVRPQPTIKWWVSSSQLCKYQFSSMSPHDCRNVDPWHGNFIECLRATFKDMEEGTGIEDLKLFEWPGRGMYGIFGRKTERQNGTHLCPRLMYHQYLMQLLPDDATADLHKMHTTNKPIQLHSHIMHEQLKQADLTKPSRAHHFEKNWMPFVHGGTLYFMYSFNPTRILEYTEDGQCLLAYENPSPVLPEHLEVAEDIHGGPPIILMPGRATRSGKSYYLGIIHHYTPVPHGIWTLKKYHHYFFKMSTSPPFNITAVSHRIPLKTEEDLPEERTYAKHVSFVSGFQFVENWKAAEYAGRGMLLISYGCSDTSARLITMPVHEMESLFDD